MQPKSWQLNAQDTPIVSEEGNISESKQKYFHGLALALDWADWRPADYPLVTRVMAVSQENQSANWKDIFYDVEEEIVKTDLVSESFEQSFSF